MQGLMMDIPLLTSSILAHADRWHGDREIVSRFAEGETHRYNYHEAHGRARRLANALTTLGITSGDRVGTLAWNNFRHFELYFGISGMGAVTHTINPRLFEEQVVYIINHAQDRVIFFDATFLPLVEKIAPQCPGVDHYVLMSTREEMPESTRLPKLLCYEALLAEATDQFEWPQLDEKSAAALCYTSGTTGNPKGVVYSHRSTLLHTISSVAPDVLNISARDCLFPAVPMYHIIAWCQPFSAALTGARIVLPGPNLDGASLYEIMECERVTLSASNRN